MAKPEVKVYLKGKEGGFVDLFAFWRNDNGMLSGKPDRGLVAIQIVTADGEKKVLRPNEKGFFEGYYVNVKMDAPPASGGGQKHRRVDATKKGDDFPADDDAPDDLPF